ncbi:MAG TPA: hypothetical protein VEJ63_04310 [Planctomycetota bacterium]|nr:hypothetical protein [Planctomycetota bacterium]
MKADKHDDEDELLDETEQESDAHDEKDNDWYIEALPEGIRDYAEKAKDYAMKAVDENPGRALAIAFGAGALAAAMIGGTRTGRKTVKKMVKALPKSVRKPIRRAVNI